jgi:VanZ family protein
MYLVIASLPSLRFMKKRMDLLALLVYCSLIYWLSDQQTLPTPDLFDNEDKLHHFLAYFLMGVFAWRAFNCLTLHRGLLFLASFSFCSVYGLSDEWHQSFVVGRDSSAMDWLADSVGGLAATFTVYLTRVSRG